MPYLRKSIAYDYDLWYTCVKWYLQMFFSFFKILLVWVVRGITVFHMKITASVTKSLLQDHGPCYLHLPIFFLYIHSPLLLENKLFWSLFSSANKGNRPLFNDIYYNTILVWELVSVWITSATHCPYCTPC